MPHTTLDKLKNKFNSLNLDVLCIRNTQNLNWITQFKNVFDFEQAHVLILTKNECILHTDSRYSNAFRECNQKSNLDIIINGDSKNVVEFYIDYINKIAKATKHVIKVGVEDVISLSEFRKVETKVNTNVELVETHDLIANLRICKTNEEIKFLKKAQEIADSAFLDMYDYIKPGMSEMHLSDKLSEFIKNHGGEGVSFDSIVAGGANAANSHAQPGEYKVKIGECVLFDFGCKYNEYRSDTTRCIFLGEPSDRLKSAFFAVRDANEACEEMIKAGLSGKLVNDKANEVLAKCGYEGKMGHSIGHGLGVEIHELPFMGKDNHILEEGCVVTVEPGVYFPGEFGIRLEDSGVVTKNGYEVFTKLSHDMYVKKFS